MLQNKFLSIVILIFVFACQQPTNFEEQPSEKQEAIDDSLALVNAYRAQEKIKSVVYPSIETKAIRANSGEDAADDPAIWVNPNKSSMTLVYGSNKKGGLAVYNMEGDEVDYYPIGNINNVDILYDFPMGDSLVSVLGCSNRSSQGINLFHVNATNGKLTNIAIDELKMDTSLIDDIYGFCFAKDTSSNKNYTVINGKNGLMQQYEMLLSSNKIELKLVRSIQFDSQTEGMVADNYYGVMYVGEEGKGIWKITIDPKNTKKTFLINSGETNPNISYDVEGLTLCKKGKTGYLVASSQGNFSYAVFNRTGKNEYLKSFKIMAIDELDGVEETDGLDITTDAINAQFPDGLLVVQDGFNYNGDTLFSQNFKYISMKSVLELIEEK